MSETNLLQRVVKPRVGDTWEIQVPGKRKKVKVVGRVYKASCYVKPGVVGRRMYVEWQRQPKGRYSGMFFRGLWKYGRLVESATDKAARVEAHQLKMEHRRSGRKEV